MKKFLLETLDVINGRGCVEIVEGADFPYLDELLYDYGVVDLMLEILNLTVVVTPTSKTNSVGGQVQQVFEDGWYDNGLLTLKFNPSIVIQKEELRIAIKQAEVL